MRILLVKTSSLGDVVHNLPVASDLRRRYPEAEIHWCVEESFADIPAMHPAVSRVIPTALRRWRHQWRSTSTWGEMAEMRRALQSQYYDVVLDTQGLLKSALIARQAFGPVSGFSSLCARERMAAWFYRYRYTIPRGLHAVLRNRWLAAAAFGYADQLDDRLPLDYGLEVPCPQAEGAMGAVRKPYVVFLTATSRADKTWPESHWQALGQALAARGLSVVLPSGTAAEQAVATRIAEAIPGACVLPRQSLAVTAALLQESTAVVGVDTGLAHLAVALNRPTIGLYMSTEPVLTGLYGREECVCNLGGVGQVPEVGEVLGKMLTTLEPLAHVQV